MVTVGMKRYRHRTAEQERYIGPGPDHPLDQQTLFGQAAPLRLELGCGHGEFITAVAAQHPQEQVIGVEYDRLRVTKIAHKLAKAGLDNARIFHDEAHHFVRHRVPTATLQRCYILFPDPWPRRRHRRRRLINRCFLLDLAWAMAPGGQVVLASDRHDYVMQALTNISTLPGLWRNRCNPRGYAFDIPTRFPTLFETYKKAAGCSIAYLLLERDATPPPPRLIHHRPGKGAL